MEKQKELIKVSENRIYIEPDPQIVPGVTHMGRLDFSSASQPLEPHTHDGAVEFCYIERGVAVFQSGKQKWSLKGGDCFVSYADEVHGTGSHPFERMKLFWIGYKPEIVSSWLTGGCNDTERLHFEKSIGSSLPRSFGGSKRMGASIGGAIDAYIGMGSFRTIEIKSALLNLLLHLAEKKSKAGIISDEINSVISYIGGKITDEDSENISLGQCADIAGLSLSRFKARFKSETGIPPAEFIMRRRIQRAAELLAEGQSVLEASIECGFSSSQYFATAFRRYRNMSPSDWIKACRSSI